MDLRLPGMNGSETVQAIRSEFPDARIVMLSTYVCDEEIYGALQAGAMAYLVKSVQREELIRAIRKAAAGQRHIPPRSPRGWLIGSRDPSFQRGKSKCCACWSAAGGTAKSPVARYHRRHGQAARQQYPRQARRGRPDEAVTVALQRGSSSSDSAKFLHAWGPWLKKIRSPVGPQQRVASARNRAPRAPDPQHPQHFSTRTASTRAPQHTEHL